MPTIKVPSYAKLNLYLRVAGVRPDGFHDIETVFERISLRDTITISPLKGSAIRIRCRVPGIPLDEKNLCHRAASALKEEFKVDAGCEIAIEKNIPAGAGMGGGSSNAAATLAGLCRLWRIKAAPARLARIGASIGSDVAFFLTGARYAIGTGRGERLRPFPGRGPTLYHVIVVPPIHCSTKEIYDAWDRAQRSRRPELTTPSGDATMIFSALKRRDLIALREAFRNDLESVAGRAYPAIPETIGQLSREPGSAGTLMTGSGSAVFGVFTSRNAAVTCARRLARRRGSRIFFAETR